jgi:hypothetical protein
VSGRLAGSLGPIALGLGVAALLASGALAVQAVLPGPLPGDQVAVRAVSALERLRSSQATEFLPGRRRIGAACRVTGAHATLRLGRDRAVLTGAHVIRISGPATHGGLLAAEADLSGCPPLLARELVSRLLTRSPVLLGAILVDGRPAWRLRLGTGRAWDELDVAKRGYSQLRVVFHDRRFWSRSIVVIAQARPARESGRAGSSRAALRPARRAWAGPVRAAAGW